MHNVTEGVGIIAPVLERRPSIAILAGLACVAGLPAIFGLWLGAFAFSSYWAALALAIGAGAILQVIIEVGLLLWNQIGAGDRTKAYAVIFAGLLAGVALMYFTGLLVQI